MCLHMSDFIRYFMATVSSAALIAISAPVFAQDTDIEPPQSEPRQDIVPDEEADQFAPQERVPLEELKNFGAPDSTFDGDAPSEAEGSYETALDALVDATTEVPKERPDYSRLPESAEREVRLDALFERLQAEENAEAANLVAEEIWAIWLDSGSASVDMLLRRGTAAQKRGNDRLARRMYNHVTELSPYYAEGWARSARLAYDEGDLSRALTEVTQALILEPRQFYAHWTLGNILEKIGKSEAAYEAYKEAVRLYPELMPVKNRLEEMKGSIEGDVL